mgnify:CR=1 FL=1
MAPWLLHTLVRALHAVCWKYMRSMESPKKVCNKLHYGKQTKIACKASWIFIWLCLGKDQKVSLRIFGLLNFSLQRLQTHWFALAKE